MALRLADYVVNEAGFASDLGAEKYFDVVMRSSGIRPAVAVLVTTVQSLRAQGHGSLQAGLPNLAHHIGSLRNFGVPVVVAINQFPADEASELQAIAVECSQHGVPCSIVEAYLKGGLGAADLAQTVVSTIEANPAPNVHSIYSLEDSLEEKIGAVAIEVYGASGVNFTDQARTQLARFAEWGFAALPVCIAKTQYSLTDNPKVMGAPTGWTLNITDARLSAGAGFVIAVAGNMMLMPGLPRAPRALTIDVDDDGNITGV
jgi:formate--tetrahydrofolate ligase